MPKGILGKKLGMTQLYENDRMIPVTLLEAGPCVVTQVKTEMIDGYSAVQLGFGPQRKQRVNQPKMGHFSKAGVEPVKHLAEVRLPEGGGDVSYELGQTLDVSIFEVGEKADVIATSKGRGYAGVMKRHNFKGLGASHGVHRVHRHGGSIGASATPSRVLPGKKMSGQYGNARVTAKNLVIVKVDAERNVIAVKGAVPGPNGGVVMIRVNG